MQLADRGWPEPYSPSIDQMMLNLAQQFGANCGVIAFSGMGSDGSAGVKVQNIVESDAPGRRVHNPTHPSADADGYVTHANVNPVEEMVNMISASRSYQNNIEVMSTAKNLLLKTLQLGQS